VEMLEELNREARTTLVMVTHDLGLAARAHRVISLAGGRIVSDRDVATAAASPGSTRETDGEVR